MAQMYHCGAVMIILASTAPMYAFTDLRATETAHLRCIHKAVLQTHKIMKFKSSRVLERYNRVVLLPVLNLVKIASSGTSICVVVKYNTCVPFYWNFFFSVLLYSCHRLQPNGWTDLDSKCGSKCVAWRVGVHRVCLNYFGSLSGGGFP